jgi:hypothetical protein
VIDVLLESQREFPSQTLCHVAFELLLQKQQKQQSSKTTKETTKAGKVFGSGSRSEKSGFSAEVTGGADVKVELAGDMVVESEAVAWGAATEETWGGDADDTWASTAAKAFKANSKAKK